MFYTTQKSVLKGVFVLTLSFALTSSSTYGVLPEHFNGTHEQAVQLVTHEIVSNLPVKWKLCWDKSTTAQTRLLYNVHNFLWLKRLPRKNIIFFIEEQLHCLAWEEALDPMLGELTPTEEAFSDTFFFNLNYPRLST